MLIAYTYSTHISTTINYHDNQNNGSLIFRLFRPNKISKHPNWFLPDMKIGSIVLSFRSILWSQENYPPLLQFQVRTSYLPNEILWGHQFDHNVLIYDKKMGSYQVHHSRVNKTLLDDTPRVSARQLHMRSKRNSSGLSNSTSTDHSPSKKPFKKAQSATNAWRQHHHKLIIITYHINNYSNYSFVSFFGFDW